MSRVPRGFRMAFLCGARKNGEGVTTGKVENLDVAVSWPRQLPPSLIRYSVGGIVAGLSGGGHIFG